MNAQKLGSPKLVKIASYIYFVPFAVVSIVWLGLMLAGSTLSSPQANNDGSAALGLGYAIVMMPLFLYAAVATPVYAIILAAYVSSGHASQTRKTVSIATIILIAGLWIWQIAPWLTQLT